jgi:hypothetical protein
MLETAIRRRYPVDAARAAETVNAFLGDADPRVALRAAQIAAVMEGQNQKDEHNAAIAALVEIRAQLASLGHHESDHQYIESADSNAKASGRNYGTREGHAAEEGESQC